MIKFEDAKLSTLFDKMQTGQSLDATDGRILYRSHDLHGIARLANYVREKHYGNRTWRRLDLGDAPLLVASNNQRIDTLLALPKGEEYEPPLDPQLSGFGYLKHIAVARLLLNDPQVHIVARHCAEVENVCQLALAFGADTLVGSLAAGREQAV
jgi:2-iminoacetate synthase ThiH